MYIIVFPDAVRNYSFCRFFLTYVTDLKTFPLTWPSQHSISYFLWQHTKSIRPTLTTKALRMASRSPSAPPIPFYLSIWPWTIAWRLWSRTGPSIRCVTLCFSWLLLPRLLSHFAINVSTGNQIMTDGCMWRNVTLSEGGGHEIDTVVTLKRPVCQVDGQGCLAGKRKNVKNWYISVIFCNSVGS